MNKYVLVAALASGLVMGSGVATVSADEGLQTLNMAQLDNVSAAGRYKRRHHYRTPTALAASSSSAVAVGNNIVAVTYNSNIADSSVGFASSYSAGLAYASGY